MKVTILAGGKGTRLSEETIHKPKPLVEIGGKPILWHIMKIYRHFGFDDFLIALGYKGEEIRKNSSINDVRDWNVQFLDTGEDTETGGRIKRLKSSVGNQTFMLTWGDGVANVDIKKLFSFHKSHGKLATVTAVQPPPRFGCLDIDESNLVKNFKEKPVGSEGWINGAFFVLEPEVFSYIEGDEIVWEKEPMERLAQEGQLVAYKHHSFWQCMDTLKDKNLLDSYWTSGNAPWKLWEE